MFEVAQRVAKPSAATSNVGVSVGSQLFWIWQTLMTAERTVDELIYSKEKEMIEELDRELTKLIEDFLCGVDVEALPAKSTHRLNMEILHSQCFRVEQELCLVSLNLLRLPST